MTLWLHIGLPKTGTSALQVFFARNAPNFRRRGWAYPWGNNARDGAVTSGNGTWLWAWLGDYPHQDPRGKRVAQLLRDGRNVLLSSEYLANADDDVLRATREMAGDVKVLVYLREQADLILAHYVTAFQVTTLGRDRTYPEFAADYYADRRYIRFGEHLDALSDIFGHENLKVRSYKQARRRLAEDAIEVFGLDPSDFDFHVPGVNRTIPHSFRHPEVALGLREACREDNARVVARWFPGLTVEDVFDYPELG